MQRNYRSKMRYALDKGLILLAEPFMEDPHFKKAALLLCDYHPTDGAFGLILNKSLDIEVSSLISSMPPCNYKIYYGGPVQTDVIHFLHRQGDLIEQSHEVLPGVFWGGDFEQVKFCIENELMGPHDIRFFVGYSGWDSEQLLEELGPEEPSWLLARGDANYVFKELDDLHKKILEDEGDSYGVIGQIGEVHYN